MKYRLTDQCCAINCASCSKFYKCYRYATNARNKWRWMIVCLIVCEPLNDWPAHWRSLWGWYLAQDHHRGRWCSEGVPAPPCATTTPPIQDQDPHASPSPLQTEPLLPLTVHALVTCDQPKTLISLFDSTYGIYFSVPTWRAIRQYEGEM